MSTNQQKNINEEEVDLGSLFVIIGRGFKNLFNFIGNIFKGIFEFIITILIFLKRNTVKIIIGGLVGAVLGFMLDFDKDKIFEATMVVSPNFESTKQLYKNIEFYNNLVAQKEKESLIEVFNINEDDALTLRQFSIDPIENENDIIDGYSNLVISVDTLAIKKYPLEEYRKSFTKYDYDLHSIKITSTNNKIFDKLESTIITSISKNDYFKKLKTLENENLERSYKVFEKNLNATDTLKQVYFQAIISESKKTTQGTSIDMGGTRRVSKEIELFSTINELNSNLNSVNKDKAKSSEIINVISSFQKVGSKVGGIKKNKTIIYFFIFSFLTLLFLLLIKLNKFLDNYKK